MNFERINTLLTLIANAGVVLGLVFLGIEIQLSRSATEAAAYHAQATEIQEANQNFSHGSGFQSAQEILKLFFS